MRVLMLQKGDHVDIGYIRYVDGRVVMKVDDDSMFQNVVDKKPADGLTYMKALVQQFRFSTGIVLKPEDGDKEWMKEL
jgi:hypothetical protein